ncbi:hypothetical protein BRADI_1g77785v3, partial [Brachypodium distachyon]
MTRPSANKRARYVVDLLKNGRAPGAVKKKPPANKQEMAKFHKKLEPSRLGRRRRIRHGRSRRRSRACAWRRSTLRAAALLPLHLRCTPWAAAAAALPLRAAACCARAAPAAPPDAAPPPCGPPRCFPRPSALPRAYPLLRASAFRRAGLRRRSPRASALRPKRPESRKTTADPAPEGTARRAESAKVDPSREASSDGEVAAVGGERDAGSSGGVRDFEVDSSMPGVLSQRGAAVARRSSEPISGGLLPGHGRPEDGSRRGARGGEDRRKQKEAG